MTPNTISPSAPQAIPVATPAAPAEPPPETELFRVRPSMVRRYPLRCAAYAGLIVAAAVYGTWALTQNHLTFGLLLLGAGGFLVGRFAYWFAKMNATTLLVTSRRVILESGVVTREASEFPLEGVTDIEVDQGFICRLMDVGDLVITTGSGSDKRQMVMMAVEQPLGVADRIRAAKG